jgi:hypothetical protein
LPRAKSATKNLQILDKEKKEPLVREAQGLTHPIQKILDSLQYLISEKMLILDAAMVDLLAAYNKITHHIFLYISIILNIING